MKNFIDKLSNEILEDEYFIELYKKVKHNILKRITKSQIDDLNNKEYKDILRFCDILSSSNIAEAKNIAYDIIANLYDSYKLDEKFKIFIEAILNKLGNYPALNMIGETSILPLDRYLEKEFKKENQKVPWNENCIFTDIQFDLFNNMKNEKFYSFSGPTSLGKSFLIKSFIANILLNENDKNIIILVPTKALITQYIIELKNELKELLKDKNYSVSSNTQIKSFKDTNCILVLTQERLNVFISGKHTIKVDYLFVDEAHNLSNNEDTRSPILLAAISNAMHRYKNLRIYFASPVLTNPEMFLEMFKLEKAGHKSVIEKTVTQNVFFVDYNNKEENEIGLVDEYTKEIITCPNPYNDRFELMLGAGYGFSNLVYCNSIAKTFEIAEEFKEYVKSNRINLTQLNKDDEILLNRAVKEIETMVHKDCYLVECLKFGIGYHFSYLPETIKETIELLFKKGIIKYLFCTSTLLQGVNLPAKNLFILTNKLGKKNMSELNLWNLMGRAGRLKKELYGNIICIKGSQREWGKDYQKKLLQKNDVIIDNNIVYKLLKDKNIISMIDSNNINEDDSKIEAANVINYEIIKNNGLVAEVIKELDDKLYNEIRRKNENIGITEDLLNKNNYINLRSLENAYNFLIKQNDLSNYILGVDVDYEACKKILYLFKEIFIWDKYENELCKGDKLNYFSFIMSVWLKGAPLNKIINISLKRYEKGIYSKIKIHRYKYEDYNGTKRHKNYIISNLIENINNILGYKFEKYFNAYYSILNVLSDEKNSGENWGEFLEYGTTNKLTIQLMNLGFSRHTATIIGEDYKEYIYLNEDEIIKIEADKILNLLEENSTEYREIMLLL